MALGPQGFTIVDLPAVPPEVLDSYDDCPHDPYMGNGTRYKRFSQYRLSWDGDDGWRFALLPHRAYTAYKQFNPVGGGMRREYQPIRVDFTPLLRLAAEAVGLDPREDWQVNLHQNRTRADAEKPGVLTPEGVHSDGHDFVMIAVLRRHHVEGGETRLWEAGARGDGTPLWRGILAPGQAVLLDDRALAHDVTDVVSPDGRPGHRDIVIAAFSRWAERWYGEEHDRAALATDAAAAG